VTALELTGLGQLSSVWVHKPSGEGGLLAAARARMQAVRWPLAKNSGLKVATRKVDVRLPGKREFKLPWREAGPPNHHDDKVDSDQ